MILGWREEESTELSMSKYCVPWREGGRDGWRWRVAIDYYYTGSSAAVGVGVGCGPSYTEMEQDNQKEEKMRGRREVVAME